MLVGACNYLRWMEVGRMTLSADEISAAAPKKTFLSKLGKLEHAQRDPQKAAQTTQRRPR